MSTSTVTSKGQITIPLSVRKRLGLDVGDRVEFVETVLGEFTLKPANKDVRELKGLLKKANKPVSIEAMRQAIIKRGSS